MYRSGSTLSYQATTAIIEQLKLDYKVVKNHTFDQAYHIIIYTYRDIRDACVSMCQTNNTGIKDFLTEGYNFEEWIEFLIRLDEVWRSYPRILTLRYRDFKDNSLFLVDSIYYFLSGKRDYVYCENLADELSFQKQKQRIESFPPEFDDPVTKLHTNQIHDGKVNKWKTFFTSEEIDRYFIKNKRLNNWLLKRNFSLDYDDIKVASQT